MSRNNIGRTSLKMKLIGMLDRKLTVGYVNDYLRGKGIATLEHDDCWLTFKLYDLDWLLLCKDGRFGIRCTFTLREDTHMESMLKAVNTLNDERYAVKAYLCGGSCKDEDGNPVKNGVNGNDKCTDFGNRECSDFGNSNAPISVTTIHNFR